MFLSPIPRPNHKHKPRRNRALEEALQSPDGHELGPILRCCNAEDTHAPAEHVDAQRSAERPSLQEEVGRELAAEVGDVEDCGEPGVLLAYEAGVLAQAEDGLGAEGGFVGLLDAVAEPLGVIG